MKTITAVLILAVVLIFSYTFVAKFAAKQDYQHCLMLNIDSYITDSDINTLIRNCEIQTGYALDRELMP